MPCSFYFAPTNYVPDSVMYYIIYIGKSVAIAKFFVFYSPLPYPNIAISIFLSNLFPLMNLLIESKACLSSISNDLPYLQFCISFYLLMGMTFCLQPCSTLQRLMYCGSWPLSFMIITLSQISLIPSFFSRDLSISLLTLLKLILREILLLPVYLRQRSVISCGLLKYLLSFAIRLGQVQISVLETLNIYLGISVGLRLELFIITIFLFAFSSINYFTSSKPINGMYGMLFDISQLRSYANWKLKFQYGYTKYKFTFFGRYMFEY